MFVYAYLGRHGHDPQEVRLFLSPVDELRYHRDRSVDDGIFGPPTAVMDRMTGRRWHLRPVADGMVAEPFDLPRMCADQRAAFDRLADHGTAVEDEWLEDGALWFKFADNTRFIIDRWGSVTEDKGVAV